MENEVQQDDLKATLNEAFEASAEPEVAPEPAAADPEPRARDEQGRFAPAPEPQEVVQTAPPARKAPSSWKAEGQAAYVKAANGEPLTPEEVALLTQEIDRREGDYHKGLEPYKQSAQVAQRFEEAVKPYMQNFQALGMDAPQAVARILHVEHTLRNGDPQTKAQMFHQLAQEYGVNLGQQMPQVDPTVAAMMQRLQQQEQRINNYATAREQEEMAKINAEIQRFSSDPKNEHYEKVWPKMAELLEAKQATSLEDAYSKAIWIDPEVRQSLIEREKTEYQKSQEESARAKRAKSAASSVRGSTPASAGTSPSDLSLRDQLRAAYDGA